MIDYNFFLHDAVPILRCNGTDDHADAVEWAVAEIERLRAALRYVETATASLHGLAHVTGCARRALGGKP